VHSVSSDTLVRLASGLYARCVKKQCGLVGLCFGGCMAFDLRLSRARTGVVAMRQDSRYHEIGENFSVIRDLQVGALARGPS
jgi:hypothetical protein